MKKSPTPRCEAVIDGPYSNDGISKDQSPCVALCWEPWGKFFLCAAHHAMADAGDRLLVRAHSQTFVING